MKPNEKNVGKILEQHIPKPSLDQMESAGERVLQRLRSETEVYAARCRACASRGLPEGPMAEFDRGRPFWRLPRLAVVSAAAAVLVISLIFVWRSTSYAVVETADGGSYRISYGEPIRSNDASGTILVLADGSRIEMRSQSEVVLESADDGARIRLDRGSVIVTASEQRAGHLYVETKDCTVSVSGTVFLVNTEEAGSRVAVIQGEVQVQQGVALDKLLPGEQIATHSSMKPLSFSEWIAWSRDAAALRALLAESAGRPAVEFEVATIKFDNGAGKGVDSPFAGLACNGTDGIRRAAFGSGEFRVPKGACVGGHVPLAHLIAYAHDIARWRVVGGPEWLQFTGNPFQGFQIETKAKNPSTATTEQLRQLLQSLLAERFKVRFHREIQEVEGYALVAGKDRPKLREVSGPEELPRRTYEKDQFIIKGKSSIGKFADFLSGPQFGLTLVLDQTNLAGNYDYTLALNPTSAGTYEPSIAAALQAQLGLRLESRKIPVEVIVVDHAEQPSEN